MKVVIIAAGIGSRLWERSNQTPKTLLPFGRGTILSTIVETFTSVGLDEFVIVVGFQANDIVSYVEASGFGGRVEFVHNADWRRGNGLSVLAAAGAVGQAPFILSMSDHIVTPGALRRVAESPSVRNLLLVDSRVDGIFDIDDATKVQAAGADIVAIGKELESYNAIDCGIFRLNARFFSAMRSAAESGHESISAGVTDLIRAADMEAVFMDPDHTWIDLDTPEAYRHALDGPAFGRLLRELKHPAAT